MSEIEYVEVAHVPVPEGVCVLIPGDDLDDPARYALWSRAYFADGIFSNPKWRELGQRLYAEELQACAAGNVDAAVRMLLAIPQALEFGEVRGLFERLAWKRDGSGWKKVAGALTRSRPHRRGMNVPTRRAVDIVNRGASLMMWRSPDARRFSLDAMIDAATEGRAEDAASIRANYERYRDRFRKTYPRAVRDAFPCQRHGDLFSWDHMEAARAPRLILRAPAVRPHERRQPEGTALDPVELMLWAPAHTTGAPQARTARGRQRPTRMGRSGG